MSGRLRPFPYPVQILGTEILLEFIGDANGTGAPRLAETRPGPGELASLWSQLVEAMVTLAGAGFAHGDLPAMQRAGRIADGWITSSRADRVARGDSRRLRAGHGLGVTQGTEGWESGVVG